MKARIAEAPRAHDGVRVYPRRLLERRGGRPRRIRTPEYPSKLFDATTHTELPQP